LDSILIIIMAIRTTQKIIDFLIRQDACFQLLYDKFGLIEYEEESTIFESIVFTIVGQMLSNKAASTIYGRIVTVLKEVTPETVIGSDIETLRACGTSYAKIKYIKNFAKMYANHQIDFKNLSQRSDKEVVDYLTKVDGIGVWTAEMIALFTLGRENIFSIHDVALKYGIMRAHLEFKTLSKYRFEQLRKRYSPYCSYASLYFYKLRDSK